MRSKTAALVIRPEVLVSQQSLPLVCPSRVLSLSFSHRVVGPRPVSHFSFPFGNAKTSSEEKCLNWEKETSSKQLLIYIYSNLKLLGWRPSLLGWRPLLLVEIPRFSARLPVPSDFCCFGCRITWCHALCGRQTSIGQGAPAFGSDDLVPAYGCPFLVMRQLCWWGSLTIVSGPKQWMNRTSMFWAPERNIVYFRSATLLESKRALE